MTPALRHVTKIGSSPKEIKGVLKLALEMKARAGVLCRAGRRASNFRDSLLHACIRSTTTQIVRRHHEPADYWDALKRRTLLMFFEKPSLRTRVSLEAGMTSLGGHGIAYMTGDYRWVKRSPTKTRARCCVADVRRGDRKRQVAGAGHGPRGELDDPDHQRVGRPTRTPCRCSRTSRRLWNTSVMGMWKG